MRWVRRQAFRDRAGASNIENRTCTGVNLALRICARGEPGQGEPVSQAAELEKPHVSPASDRLPGRLWLLLFVLAAIQFTNIVDFLIMMPLGPQFMRIFEISPGQFGFVVSAYAFSAGLSGLVAAFFLDRFDRRKAILALYAGLTLGALLCGLAPNFPALVGARIFTDSGGIIRHQSRDGRFDSRLAPRTRDGHHHVVVFGMAAVEVLLGLELADRGGWHTPFFFLAGAGVVIWLIAARLLPSMRGHLAASGADRPRPMQQIREIVAPANHRRAYALMASLTLAGISVVPHQRAHGREHRAAGKRLKWIYWVHARWSA